MVKKKKNKGGRKRLEEGRSAVGLSISVSWSRYRLFMAYREISGKTKSEFFSDIFDEWVAEHTPPTKCERCGKFLTKFERDNEENKSFALCYPCWDGHNV